MLKIPASKTRTKSKQRGIWLTTWLVILLLVNAFSVVGFLITSLFIGILGKVSAGGIYSILSDFVPLWSAYVSGILSLLNVIFLSFLFKWKRWAFFSYVGSVVAQLIVSLVIGMGDVSLIWVIIAPGVLYLLMRPKWNLFE